MLDPWFKKKYPFKHLKKKLYWYLIQYKIIKEAKSVLFTTLEEKFLARKSFSPYKAKEKVVGYGISGNPYLYNLKDNLFFKKYPKLKEKKIIFFLGRVHPKKGVDLLIDAFEKVYKKNSKFHLIIAGPYEKKYYNFLNETFIKSSNKFKDSITWMGPI